MVLARGAIVQNREHVHEHGSKVQNRQKANSRRQTVVAHQRAYFHKLVNDHGNHAA